MEAQNTMTEPQTRIGTSMHPQVYFSGEEPAIVTMRIHLKEQKAWKRLRHPIFINYARAKEGWMIQFEVHRTGHEYCWHTSLKHLLKADFESNCPLMLVEFAHVEGTNAAKLMHEALVHGQHLT